MIIEQTTKKNTRRAYLQKKKKSMEKRFEDKYCWIKEL